MNSNEQIKQLQELNQIPEERFHTNTKLLYYQLVKGLIAPQSTSPKSVQ
jgi:hypothetical protein